MINRIADSLRCTPEVPGFRIPEAKIRYIPGTGSIPLQEEERVIIMWESRD